MHNTYVAIMAGGIGSRFWPKSRISHPKQFIDILGLGKTLLQMTFDRFRDICPAENIFIVTNTDYQELVKQQLPFIKDEQILLEPSRRNTAPCIAYVTERIYAIDPMANVVVAPSDHLVMRQNEFVDVIRKGLSFINNNLALVTLGIVPTRPDTGYGYIQHDEFAHQEGVFKVKTFTEKPTLEIAQKFLKSGDFLWNSGIFIWSIQAILEAFKENLTEVYDVFEEGKGIYGTPEERSFIEKAYALCPNISIDIGIMEKANNVYLIPADFGWSDLGTWESLYQRYEKDPLGNAVSGANVMTFESANCMIMAPDDKLILLQGLHNFCVIDTPDALLICHRDKEQEIKQFTAEVKRIKGEKFL